MPNSAFDLSLPIIGRCVRVENAADAIAALSQAMPGWPLTVQPAAGPTPDMYIYRDEQGLWQGWRDDPEEFDLPSSARWPAV